MLCVKKNIDNTDLATLITETLEGSTFLETEVETILDDGVNTIGLEDGAVATPALFFNDDPDTGIYRTPATETISFGVGGVNKLTIDATDITATTNINLSGDLNLTDSNAQLVVPDGIASAPSYSFSTDLNTGIYSPAANEVAVSCGGSTSFICTATNLTLPNDNLIISEGDIRLNDGSGVLPSFTFIDDTGAGMSRSGTGTLQFTAASLTRMTVGGGTVAMQNNSVFRASAGSVSTPGIYFASDTNTGLYQPADNQVAITCNGSQELLATASDITIPTNDLTLTAGDVNVSAGDLNVTGKLVTSATAVTASKPVTIAYQGAGLKQLLIERSAGGGAGGEFYIEDQSATKGTLNDFVITSTSGGSCIQIEPQTGCYCAVAPKELTGQAGLRVYGVRDVGGTAAYRESIRLDTEDITTEAVGRVRVTSQASKTKPDFGFLQDGDTGMYWESADQMAFSAGDTKVFELRTAYVSAIVPLRLQNGGSDLDYYGEMVANSLSPKTDATGATAFWSAGGSNVIFNATRVGCVITLRWTTTTQGTINTSNAMYFVEALDADYRPGGAVYTVMNCESNGSQIFACMEIRTDGDVVIYDGQRNVSWPTAQTNTVYAGSCTYNCS